MPRPLREPPSPIVPALLRYLAARGHDTDAMLVRFGLPADAAERDEIDCASLDELIEAAALAVGEPYLALRLPAELPFRRYSLGELAARAAPTLADSLRAIAPYVHAQMTCELAGRDWRQATPAHPRGLGRYAHEYGLAYVVTHARAVAGPLTIERVWFAHPRPKSLAPLERWFGCEDLGFGAVDSGFTLAADALARPLVTADPRLAATIAELAPAAPARDDLTTRVGSIVRERLPEPTTADDAAALLHMSARTLQRRLEADGTTFTAVVDATREARARELLATDAPLGEIGYQLGFADLATFSRAFKRWTGTSPGRFRRILRP